MTGRRGFPFNQPGGRLPAGGWLSFIMVLPLVIGALLVGIFFFTAFLALFSLVLLAVGARFWWMRRKLRRAATTTRGTPAGQNRSSALEGEYVVIGRDADGKNR